MRQSGFHGILGLASAAGLLLALAAPAEARLLRMNGTLSLELGGLGTITISGGGPVVLNGSSGQLGGHLSAVQVATPSLISGTATVPVTGVPLVVSLRGTAALGTGVLRPISGGGGALTQKTLPVPGTVRVCVLFMGCSSFID